MLDVKIQKGDLGQQLWPFSFQQILVFSDELNGHQGIFGIKGNSFFFVHETALPSEMEIQVPDNLEQVQAFLITAEYALHRCMMTKKLYVHGVEDTENIKIPVMKSLQGFIDNYADNVNNLEGIKHGYL